MTNQIIEINTLYNCYGSSKFEYNDKDMIIYHFWGGGPSGGIIIDTPEIDIYEIDYLCGDLEEFDIYEWEQNWFKPKTIRPLKNYKLCYIYIEDEEDLETSYKGRIPEELYKEIKEEEKYSYGYFFITEKNS